MSFMASSPDLTLGQYASEEDVVLGDKKYRKETVYDAVAGRIAATGFIPRNPFLSSTRDTASSSTVAAPPESVLFRRKTAPTRYAEDDIYFASERDLIADLPESDLLKALHCYTSDFYSRSGTAAAEAVDWRSMDETALLALGILMEEAARDIVSENGDLVFTEGQERGYSGVGFISEKREARHVLPLQAKNHSARARKRRRIVEANEND